MIIIESVNNAISNAFEALQKISETASRKTKESIVETMSNSSVFKSFFKMAYDPFTMYYVKKVPTAITKVKQKSLYENYSAFLWLLSRLNQRELTGNAAFNKIIKTFSHMSDLEIQWYTRVIQKDLKIGMTVNTYNKVMISLTKTNDLINTFSCSLAETYKVTKIPHYYSLEPKLDGYRCLAFVYPDYVEMRSRNGKFIEGYSSIEQEVSKLPSGFVYDGEIMSPSGLFSDMQKFAQKKDMKDKPGIFNIFDIVPIDSFLTKNTIDIYEERRELLSNHFEGIESDYLKLVPIIKTGTILDDKGVVSAEMLKEAEKDILEVHRQLLSEGYEGTMLKDLKATYKSKRSWDIQKIKDMDTVDLTIIDFQEGAAGSQFEGMLGALVVNYKGCKVKVGSGFTPEQRKEIWDNRSTVVNSVAEIKYFEESKDKEGNLSLRFPIFIQFRYDKD